MRGTLKLPPATAWAVSFVGWGGDCQLWVEEEEFFDRTEIKRSKVNSRLGGAGLRIVLGGGAESKSTKVCQSKVPKWQY